MWSTPTSTERRRGEGWGSGTRSRGTPPPVCPRGETDFVKYFLNGKVFFPVTTSTVLSGNVLWGHAISTVGGRVPIFERFFLGGPYSIRGFASRTLSPTDPNTGERIGGNKEHVVKGEERFSLAGEGGF